MRVRYFLPSPDLQAVVKYYWLVETNGTGLNNISTVISPSGYPELIFNFGDFVALETSGSGSLQAPTSMIAGQITLPVKIQFSGFLNCLCVKLNSYGLAYLLKIPGTEFTDKATDLSQIHPSMSRIIYEQLSEASSDPARVSLVENHLRKLIGESKNTPDPCSLNMVNEILASSGQLKFTELNRSCNCSVRTLQRKFLADVGMSAKKFTRITRFNDAFFLKKNNPQLSFQDIVFKCGYYDLSHYINDFQEFTGKSPYRYFKEKDIYNQLFVGIK